MDDLLSPLPDPLADVEIRCTLRDLHVVPIILRAFVDRDAPLPDLLWIDRRHQPLRRIEVGAQRSGWAASHLVSTMESDYSIRAARLIWEAAAHSIIDALDSRSGEPPTIVSQVTGARMVQP